MGFIDFILSIAGLLLWLSWRSIHFDPFRQTAPATLAGTVRRTEAPLLRRWHFLAALGLLLVIRGFIYWRISPAVNWTPRINLTVVVLAFRGDALGPEMLFSFLSFGRAMLIFHFWLLALAAINRETGPPNTIQKLIILQLGGMARLPRWSQALLPIVFVAGSWFLVHPLLTRAHVVNPAQSALHLLEQGLLLGAATYLSLKYLLSIILILHVLTSYVYFGSSPVWDFIATTAQNILSPLNALPLRVRKMDFAPLIAIGVILFTANLLPITRWSAQTLLPNSKVDRFLRQQVLWPR